MFTDICIYDFVYVLYHFPRLARRSRILPDKLTITPHPSASAIFKQKDNFFPFPFLSSAALSGTSFSAGADKLRREMHSRRGRGEAWRGEVSIDGLRTSGNRALSCGALWPRSVNLWQFKRAWRRPDRSNDTNGVGDNQGRAGQGGAEKRFRCCPKKRNKKERVKSAIHKATIALTCGWAHSHTHTYIHTPWSTYESWQGKFCRCDKTRNAFPLSLGINAYFATLYELLR